MRGLLILSAAFLLGCGEKETVPVEGQNQPLSSRREAPRELRAVALKTSGASGSAASGESDAQRWRASFDGDLRALPVAAGPASGSWVAASQVTLMMAEPRKLQISGQEPPIPSTPAPDPAGSELRGAGPTLLAFDAFQKKAYETWTALISRLGWGASAPSKELKSHHPFRVTIHHTGGPMPVVEAEAIAEARSIQAYHMAGRARQKKPTFDDVGYHFLIDGAGRILEGRPAEKIGEHAKGANTGNIGIALMGDFNKVKPAPAQVESLKRLITFLALRYKKDPGQKGFIESHNHLQATACPGKNLLSIIERITQDVDREAGRVAELGPVVPPVRRL